MTFGRIFLAAVAAMTIGASAAQAEQIFSPAGTWVTNGGESKYAIELCGKRGDAICAKLIWADDSALGQRIKTYVGKDAMIELARTGNQRWYGKLQFQGQVGLFRFEAPKFDNFAGFGTAGRRWGLLTHG